MTSSIQSSKYPSDSRSTGGRANAVIRLEGTTWAKPLEPSVWSVTSRSIGPSGGSISTSASASYAHSARSAARRASPSRRSGKVMRKCSVARVRHCSSGAWAHTAIGMDKATATVPSATAPSCKRPTTLPNPRPQPGIELIVVDRVQRRQPGGSAGRQAQGRRECVEVRLLPQRAAPHRGTRAGYGKHRAGRRGRPGPQRDDTQGGRVLPQRRISATMPDRRPKVFSLWLSVNGSLAGLPL